MQPYCWSSACARKKGLRPLVIIMFYKIMDFFYIIVVRKWRELCEGGGGVTNSYQSATPVLHACVPGSSPADPTWVFHEKYSCFFPLNPLTAKLFKLNFYPLEVVSRWRDPQLQVSENYSDLTILRSTVFKSCWLMSHFILNIFKRWYLLC